MFAVTALTRHERAPGLVRGPAGRNARPWIRDVGSFACCRERDV